MEEEAQKTEQGIEAEISRAMRARVKDFKDQADSLTLEGVRRALEKDLGMDTFSLDVHKRFIKQCLDECFFGGDDVNLTTTAASAADQQSLHLNKEASGGKDEPLEEPKISGSNINVIAVESPAKEQMTNHVPMETGDFEDDSKRTEDIRESIKKQGPYFRANLEKITMVKVRRLLEQDLNLEKNTLDAYKGFISGVLDEVLQSSETCEVTNGTKKKPKKDSKSKETEKIKKRAKTAAEDSGSSNLDNDASEDDEDTVVVKKQKKRPLQKAKSSMKPIKQQKTSSDENMPSGSRKKKLVESDKEKGSQSDDGRSSGDGHEPSSSDERSKKQEKPTAQAHGKHVEHLKSVIKACGMGVPPSVYKRAKQAPESKREAFLIKELKDILAKEGLSSNPSDKEIKAVKKKKERARELEGIDTSNIVSSSRRRSTSSFIPTPKPKIEAGSDEDEENEADDEVEEDEDDHDGTDDGENGSGESSEGSEEDADEDSE